MNDPINAGASSEAPPLLLTKQQFRVVNAENDPEFRGTPYAGTKFSAKLRTIGRSRYTELVRKASKVDNGIPTVDPKKEIALVLGESLVEWSGIESVDDNGKRTVVPINEQAFDWLATHHYPLAIILVNASINGRVVSVDDIKAEAGNS